MNTEYVSKIHSRNIYVDLLFNAKLSIDTFTLPDEDSNVTLIGAFYIVACLYLIRDKKLLSYRIVDFATDDCERKKSHFSELDDH